jgi:hypothetical protein
MKQNKAKQNKTKQYKTKQNKLPSSFIDRWVELGFRVLK